MKQHRLDVQEAMDKIGGLADEKMDRFYYLYPRIPRFLGPVDLDVQLLVDGMAQCVSGVMHWSYESQRYFGKIGLEIKQSRRFRLLPKVKMNGTLGPVPVNDTLIACQLPMPRCQEHV